MDEIDLDLIKDISLEITDELVVLEIIPNCKDTDDNTEFDVQDVIREVLCKRFNIEND